MLSKSQMESFDEKGFLILDDFFSQQEVDDFRRTTQQVIRGVLRRAQKDHPGADLFVPFGEEFDLGTQKLNAIDHDYIAEIYDTVCFTPAFFRIAGKLETQAVVNQLLGRESDAAIFGFKNRCRIDAPGDARRISGWHQQYFSGVPWSGEFIQTWAPLIHNNTAENGTLSMAVGSHKVGVPKQHWTDETESKVVQIVVDQEVVDSFEHVVMETTVRQLVVFTGTTIHCSGVNTSDQTRYSLVGEYYNIDEMGFRAPKPTRRLRGTTQREFYDAVARGWDERAA